MKSYQRTLVLLFACVLLTGAQGFAQDAARKDELGKAQLANDQPVPTLMRDPLSCYMTRPTAISTKSLRNSIKGSVPTIQTSKRIPGRSRRILPRGTQHCSKPDMRDRLQLRSTFIIWECFTTFQATQILR